MLKRSFLVFFFSLVIALTSAPFFLKAGTMEVGADNSLALSNLAVPEEIGKVQERFTGKGSRTIVQIQDVHAHAIAQQNIAAILERLRMTFGIEKAALEGAWSSTSLPKSRAIPTSREKQLLTGTLLDDDRISGPISAAIMSSKSIMLVGMEDEAFYEKNRALFLAHLEKEKEIVEKLRTYGASLQESQKAPWGPELLSFGDAFGKFRETSDLGRFLPLLLETASNVGVVFSGFPQIVSLHDILALEKSLSKERLDREIRQITQKYKDKPWTLEELIRGGKIAPEEIGLYPEIKKLTHLYQMRDGISLRELMGQIETLIGQVLEQLIKTPEENILWAKTRRFYLSKKILLLEATPDDMKAYSIEKTLLYAELAEAGLSESLALSVDFYNVVKERDEIFFNKIVNDPSLAGNIAIVTGGFHTDGLSQKFREAGISYITLTPELGNTTMNENLYNERMKENWGMGNGGRETTSLNIQRSALPESKTLSELRNAIAWIDDRFPQSYEVLLQTRDTRKAKRAFLGETITVSKPAKISYLSREGRLVPESKAGTAINASKLRISDFMTKPRLEQLETVRNWMAEAPEQRQKAMLVSSVSVLAKMLSEERTVKLLKEAVSGGDIIALAQDVPVTETPEILSSTRGIDRFEAANITFLLEKTPRFQRLAKKRPFAIMKNGEPSKAFVVLPEKPISLVLFKIITLNPNLYQAAKDPDFLARLQDLIGEILSKELSGKAA